MRSLLSVLALFVCCYRMTSAQVRDVTGQPVVTGKKYYLREVSKDGTAGSGMSYEVYHNWDYVLFSNSKASNGTAVYFWEDNHQWEVGRTVWPSSTKCVIQMTHSHYGGFDYFNLDDEPLSKNLYLYDLFILASLQTIIEIKNATSETVLGYTMQHKMLNTRSMEVVKFCLAVTNGYQGKRWLGYSKTPTTCDSQHGLLIRFHPA